MYDKLELQNLKIAIYCRKSQEQEERQVLSIPSQIHQANELLQKCNFLSKKIYSEAKSAMIADNRPEFDRMLIDIKKRKINAIVCWKMDRLARNLKEGGELIDLLQKERIKAIITPAKVFYPTENALFLAFEFGYATQFSRELSTNVKRGMLAKARKGIPHGPAPIGFLNNTHMLKGERTLSVDQSRWPLIEIIFRKMLSGTISANKLVQYARESIKLSTVARKHIGGSLITQSGLFKMLKDPIYAGFFYHDGARYELSKELPRIITELEHFKIIDLIENKNVPKTKREIRPYVGFIKSPDGMFIGQDVKYQMKCDCNFKFSAASQNACPRCKTSISKMKYQVKRVYYYYYNVSLRKKGLKCKYLHEYKIKEYLKTYFGENLNFTNNFKNWILENLKFLHEQDQLKMNQLWKIDLDQETKLKARRNRLKELLIDQIITTEDYWSEIDTIDRKLSIINRKIEVTWFDTMHDHISKVLEGYSVFDNGSTESIRSLLESMGSNLVWDEKSLYIVNRKSVDTLIKGLNGIKGVFSKFEPHKIHTTYGQNCENRTACSTLLTTLENVRNEFIEEEKNKDR